LLVIPTVCLDATSLVVCSYECDDGKIAPTALVQCDGNGASCWLMEISAEIDNG
jgi:hypothetical protein